MQTTLNMAKDLCCKKGTTPDASAISNIPLMTASSHDGLALGMYQKSYTQTGNFPRLSFIKWSSKINKKLKSLDND